MAFITTTLNTLRAVTERYTKTIVKEYGNGLLLFTERGGRLLGMFPYGEGDNALWVNENLDECLLGHSAHIGGERLWISPERNFYYENPRDFEGYRIPSEIDPGEYTCKKDAETILFQNNFSLLEYDRNMLFDNSVERRSFSVIADPYNTGHPYVGVSITDEVDVNDTEIVMCAWSLTQVYTCGPESPGIALFPVKPGCNLISYFDQIPDDRAEVLENVARFKIDGSFSIKLGIRPEDVPLDNPCKAVYLSRTGSNKATWFCVIKRSNDIPRTQDECVDMAKNDPNGPKGAVQAFNTDHGSKEEMIAYPCGELGLQLKKGVAEGDKTVSRATHELLSYCGSREEMFELAGNALQIQSLPEVY